MDSKILFRPVFNSIVTGWAFFCSVHEVLTYFSIWRQTEEAENQQNVFFNLPFFESFSF
jgi:hypothetical protein